MPRESYNATSLEADGRVAPCQAANEAPNPSACREADECPRAQSLFANRENAGLRAALRCLNALECEGEAWLVGGCVRDAIRGAEPHDYDIATSLLPHDAARALERAGFACVPTGVAFGTITAVTEGIPTEVTTFRSDGTYTDDRHPDSVIFGRSIIEDLKRRDFTMNAIAWNPRRGIEDPFGGAADIAAKTIRCVGSPDERFGEDALRVLRACRFESQLGFACEEATEQAMLSHADTLRSIAPERAAKELTGILCGSHASAALMRFAPVIAVAVPEIQPCMGFDQHTPWHIYDVYEHIAHAVGSMPAAPLERWTAFLHDIGKPATFFTDETGRGHFYGHALAGVDIARRALTRLRMPASFIEDVLTLVRWHDTGIDESKRAVKRWLHKLQDRPELFRALCRMKRADALSQAPAALPRVERAERLEAMLDDVLAEEAAFSLKALAINGHDLIAAGYEPGPELGDMLEACLNAVISEQLPNDRGILLDFARACAE